MVRIERRGIVVRLYADGDDVHPSALQLLHRVAEPVVALVGGPVRDDEHEVLPAGGELPHPGGRLADGHGVEVARPGIHPAEGLLRCVPLLPVDLQLGDLLPFAVGVPAAVAVGVTVDVQVDRRDSRYGLVKEDPEVPRGANLLTVHRAGLIDKHAHRHPVGAHSPLPLIDGLDTLVGLRELPRVEDTRAHPAVGHRVLRAVPVEGLRDGGDVLTDPA